MATTLDATTQGEEETLDEIEGFDDFTLASSWERFISDIEAICRLWTADGHKNLLDKGAEQLNPSTDLYKVKSEIRYVGKTYCLEYYFMVGNGELGDWQDNLHNLQLLFGLKEFLVIAPLSASGVILDAPEASKLLSSVAIALSNCGSIWPALVPVHVPSRMAYIGIQNMGVIFTKRFETDRIGSQVPIKLMHLEGLFELFVSKFALSVTDISTRLFDVQFTMKLTYRTPPYDVDDDVQGHGASPEESDSLDSHLKAQWDDDCPWSRWYSAEDPVKGFELVTIWPKMLVQSSTEMEEFENSSFAAGEESFLFPLLSSYMNDDSLGYPVGFASQLRNLVHALDVCFNARFMEDFVSADSSGSENLKSVDTVPPPTVLHRVIKGLFHDGSRNSSHPKREPPDSRATKGAPLGSLFVQFCLQALWFGNCNIRAIAVLWIEFVREIRWCWEESEALPRITTDGGVDLSTCLVHQKLQMLAICMEKKMNHGSHDREDEAENKEDDYGKMDQVENQLVLDNLDQNDSSSQMADEYQDALSSLDVETSVQLRRGVSGMVGSMMLLNSNQCMYAPYTQEAPIMTEDMHEERIHAMEALDDTFNFSGQLEKDILCSDMSAFKAANPDAVFEDFIRWHSPGDWENIDSPDIVAGGLVEDNWPPHGRLSQRMSEHGNSWRKLWNDAPSLPVSLQKPLLDPLREGEKILHYLETLRPQQLLAQMICTAFRASLGTLNLTSYGNLKHMKTRIGQLSLTIASTLKSLKGNYLPEKAELIGDLIRLCENFNLVEKLLLVAASFSRKLSGAPRLAEAFFSDYFAFYLPKFGTDSESLCYDKVFNSKQRVKRKEQDSILNLFPPPSANQSWRRVLSMGNLLNGHEPMIREIIFSVEDKVGCGRYGTNGSQSSSDEEIETRRMYIRGTSNDLQVALSVISWD